MFWNFWVRYIWEVYHTHMKFFYLSSLPSKDSNYEVHDKDCPLIPDPINRDYLGPFNNGREAMRKALTLKSSVVLCNQCCQTGLEAIFRPSNRDTDLGKASE